MTDAVDPRTRVAPRISVIVPALNERQTLAEAIQPLLDDPLGAELEVLIAVGPSTDGTRELVAEMAARDPRIHFVDNPERITPAGLNAAIRASRGRVILRMDGHAVPEPGYVSACLRVLEASGAWNVGGRIVKVGRTRAARAASAATSSPFGIGGGQRFHTLTTSADVDTVWPGCWPRWVFERIGLFDPEMIQNQDDELNQRLLDTGGRIRFDPSIGATYLSRGSWRGLLRQYFRYGMFKVRGFQKRPNLLRPRHLAPAALVAVVVGGVLLAPFVPLALAGLGVLVAAWLVAAAVFAGRVAADNESTIPDVLLAFACIHAGYGAGMWVGLVRHARRFVSGPAAVLPRLDPAPAGAPEHEA
jgi:glycosyltransferase involved in cell wall biosynthesis